MEEWARSSPAQRRPLLLLAPFGAGKSALLAALAVRLAEAAIEGISWGGADETLIPLPVRLRALLEFSPLETRLPFLQFMHASQLALDPNDPEGVIGWDDFQRLHQERRLVPLFDGLDELPGERSGEVDRRSALRAIVSTCGDFFALAARPGYDAETYFGQADRCTLNELTPADVELFVAKRFADAPRRSEEALAQLEPQLSVSFRRPLFLNAWCELQFPGDVPPIKGTAGVMMELAVRCWDKRRAVSRISGPKLIDGLERVSWLLWAFAGRGLGRAVSLGELTGELSSHPALRSPAACAETAELALAAGWLVRTSETSWLALKIPVVEHLVGWRLAEDARTNASNPKTLIEQFRRWIWRPEMHDVLDHAFLSLWEGTPEQRSWAVELLHWMRGATEGAATRAPVTTLGVQDDLVQPFALAALRWYALLADPTEEERQECFALLPAIEAAVLKQLDNRWRCWDLLTGPTLPKWLYAALIAHLTKPADDPEQDYRGSGEWAFVVGNVARRAGAEYVDQFIGQWVERHAHDQEPCWYEAIRGAAERVSPGASMATVEHWVGSYAHANDDRSRTAWSLAIQGAASRVFSADAAACVAECLANGELAADDSRAWAAAAAGAARALPAGEAFLVVKRLVERADNRRWGQVIRNAAGCVGAEQAGRLVEYLFAELQATEDWAAMQSILGALRRTALQLREEDAENYVAQLIGAVDRRFALSLGYAMVVEAVASRLDERLSGAALLDWIDCQRRTEPPASDLWLHAIQAAAARVSVFSAGRLIDRLIERRQITGDQRWTKAICGAAGGVSASEVEATIQKLLPRYQTAGDVEKELLREAIEKTAARASLDAALEMCRWLIANGLETAARVLATARGVAIVSRIADRTSALDMQGNVLPDFEVCRREGLIFDPELIAVSSRLRTALQSDGAADSPSVRKCRLRVDLDRNVIYLDSQALPQTSRLACLIVQRLIEADGGIVPSDQLLEREGTTDPAERVKEALGKLSREVRDLIKGKPGQGGGRCLSTEAFERPF